MTGGDFLACAGRLAQSSAEADLRSAVSRAYYGAFHEALSLLRDSGVRLPKTEQVHVKVGFCLRDCGDATAAQAGRQLELLRNERRTADYELGDSRFTDGRKVQSEVARARRIVDHFDRCRATAGFQFSVRAQAKLLGLPVSD
jgi:uncharacterized protein (UPF0332 family)